MQNVHEGPIGIGTRIQYSEISLAAGNVLSDGMSALHEGRIQIDSIDQNPATTKMDRLESASRVRTTRQTPVPLTC